MVDNVSQVISGTELTYDMFFEILSHTRRRSALYYLDQYQTPLALADLGNEVARLEHDTQALSEIPKENVKRIYCDLYHCHIPKMEAANLVEYCQDQNTVESTIDLSILNLSEMV